MVQLRPCFLLFLSLAATGALGSQLECSADNAEAMMTLGQDTNELGWNLFKEILKDPSKSNENVFLSAPSISAAFGMLYLGAKGNSAKELKQTLFSNVAEDTASSAYLSLMSKLKPNSEQFKLSIANSAFVEKTAQLLDSYINPIKKCFHSEISAADFRSKPNEERVRINTWVSDKTQEKIKDLLPEGSVSTLTKLVLANAIYFKGTWLRTFNKSDTKDMTFYGFNNAETKTKMMSMDLEHIDNHPQFPFFEDTEKKIKIIELPYTGKDVSMIVLLPENQTVYEEVEKKLSADCIKKLYSKMKPNSELERLVLPKWKVSHKLNLVDLMKKLNLTSVFSAGQADLSGITGARNLYVSGAFHKAFVEVNEEGTEAAAATALGVEAMSLPLRPPPAFIANKPFIYMIWHKPTKMALFVGRYVLPQ